MPNLLNPMSCAAAALLSTLTITSAQTSAPSPAVSPAAALPTAPVGPGSTKASDNLLVVQASGPAAASPKPAAPGTATGTVTGTATGTTTTTTTETDAATESG